MPEMLFCNLYSQKMTYISVFESFVIQQPEPRGKYPGPSIVFKTIKGSLKDKRPNSTYLNLQYWILVLKYE